MLWTIVFFYDHASCYKSTLRLSPLLDFESEFNLACILQEHQVNLSNDNKDILTLRCILIDRHRVSIPVNTELARKLKKNDKCMDNCFLLFYNLISSCITSTVFVTTMFPHVF